MQKQDPEGQKNLILAIVLSMAVLIGWQYFFAGPKLKQEQERRQREQQSQAGAPNAVPLPGGVPGAPNTAPLPAAVAAVVPREAALASGARVPIDTPSLKGSIALVGGRIDDLVLTKYHEQVDPKSPNIVLLSPAGTKNAFYAEFGWLAPAGIQPKLPDAATVWTLEKGPTLTPAAPVTMAFDNGQGLVFRRTYSIDADYMFRIEDQVENKAGGQPVVLDHRALISRHGTPEGQDIYLLDEGMIGVLGDKEYQHQKYSAILDKLKPGDNRDVKFDKVTAGWLGFVEKYWAAALIPDQKTPLDAFMFGVQKNGGVQESYEVDYIQRGVAVAPGSIQTVSQNLFAGAKVVGLINAYNEKLGIKKFDLLVDWGWFHFITKPMYWLLSNLSKLLGNYGLAVLATTVIVKALFFPLASKSYESMAKMKKLQPEMEALRERYKDDKQKQQQELMELYKKQKINPAAGCLPILLQVPVFFALYKVLFVTIDMRHAPFYGWIKDLSAADPTSMFNLFGLLHYNPAAVPVIGQYLQLGVWPLIMGVTMWVQMQLNPPQPDPMQQKIFNWMPVMFTFMLGTFPAGLVIYWAWNNVLSLSQQYWIMKKNGAEIHLWRNLGVEKWLAGRRAAKG